MNGVSTRVLPAASLRSLVAHSVDYAGLFPPAGLPLEQALRNYAEFVRSPDAWMLGTFVLPVAQFGSAAAQISFFDRHHPLRVSALGPKSDGETSFCAELRKLVEAASDFSSRHDGVGVVTQIEMPLPPKADADLLSQARRIVRNLDAQIFWESSADDASATIALLAQHNANSDARAFGYKLRTGGVTAAAFPTSAQIAVALAASAQHRVPIKFTAGLHHPVRQFHESVQTKMHGFLNVLAAGVLAAEHRWNEQQIVAMLDDEDSASFRFDGDSFAWREWTISSDAIAARRKFVTSFGSCSFEEPRDDLSALNLL
jgi:hypothetical protein